MGRGAFLRLATVLVACLLASSAAADARTDFLVRMLSTSTQFRVRVQAALALGAQNAESQVVGALSRGLRDGHPSVRSASASALEKLREPSALAALEAARRDRDADVRRAVESAIASLSSRPQRATATSAPTRGSPSTPQPSGTPTYYVGIGAPGDRVGLPKAELERLRAHLVRTVAGMEGVVLAPSRESENAARKVMKADGLVGFYVDASVTKVEVRSDGAVRAEVSIVVGSYPERSIKAMLKGAATVPSGGSSPVARERAVEGAFSGALRRLPQAMRAGALAQGP